MGSIFVEAIRLKQDGREFYVFKIDARTLLRIAYTVRRAEDRLGGIQRSLNRARLKEIGSFINGHGAVFPNSLVVSLPPDTKYDANQRMLEIPDVPDSVFVIDGQHRLWAFSEEFSKVTMDLPVSGFVNLDRPASADLFVTINGNQRKINPSLVYDLFPLLRSKNALKFEDDRAQALVELLYSEEHSPWYHNIAMLGDRTSLITQASFVADIKRLFKTGGAFTWTELAEQEIQEELLVAFFTSLKSKFKTAWLNPDYILCKNTGVGAMMLLLDEILRKAKSSGQKFSDERGLTLKPDFFDEYLSNIPVETFRREQVGVEFLGEAGIQRFASRLSSIAHLK